MKNLFDYATKELSQDAFLAWLLNNWDNPEVGHISKELMAKLTNTDVNPDEITDIEAFLQYEKMDIVIDFKINGVLNLMIIEDKVRSSEHSNQLTRYKDKVIKSWNVKEKAGRPTFFVYYKTGNMNEQEIRAVKDARWLLFPFESIKDFWSSYQNDGNLIIAQYANHIVESWNDSQYKELPIGGDNEKLLPRRLIQRWAGFFENYLKPNIDLDCDICVKNIFYGYAAFQVKKKGKANDNVPYLEIKSRDCVNSKFVASVLLHDADEKYFDKARKMLCNNPKGTLFKCKTEIKKQIASTGKYSMKSNNKEEFLELTKKAIGEFLDLMTDMEKTGE